MDKVRGEKIKEGKDQRRESQKREDAGARKGRKVVTRCFFGSGGSKSRLAKAVGAETSAKHVWK